MAMEMTYIVSEWISWLLLIHKNCIEYFRKKMYNHYNKMDYKFDTVGSNILRSPIDFGIFIAYSQSTTSCGRPQNMKGGAVGNQKVR